MSHGHIYVSTQTVHVQRTAEWGSVIFACWKLIPWLCSLNGAVPFLLFWIPASPVQPEETLSCLSPLMKLCQIQFPFLCPFFPFYRPQRQFQIASSSRVFSSLLILSTLFFCHLFSYSRQMIGTEEHKVVRRRLTPSRKRRGQKKKIIFYFVESFF